MQLSTLKITRREKATH